MLDTYTPTQRIHQYLTDQITTFSRIQAQESQAAEIETMTIINRTSELLPRDWTQADLVSMAAQAAAEQIETDPIYDQLAAHLAIQGHNNRLLQTSISKPGYPQAYQNHFCSVLEQSIRAGILDERLGDFNAIRLAQELVPERDYCFRFMGAQTLLERYLLRSDDQPMETIQGFWMRVAMGLALNESAAQRDTRAIEFYQVMSSLRFIPSTPTLFHSGLPHSQLSSCYLTTIQDDLSDIFKAMGDNARLAKWSGGIGNDWTNIRGTGALIKSTRVQSQGVIPFLKIANDVTLAINRSGKRRGATCAYLETWHYDIEDFLDLRRNTGDDRRRTHDMNTANWIPDLFMQRVQQNAMWTLFSPDEVPDLHDLYGKEFAQRYEFYEQQAEAGAIKLFRRVEAKKLWRKMLTRLFETGHPWITFKDPCNIRSPQDHVGTIHNSNLCTEITLNTSPEETAVCNLGSINLPLHLSSSGGSTLEMNNLSPQGNPTPQLDAKLLEQTITTAMRMLDNVIDLNFYPTPESRVSNQRHRPVGLGVLGFQDLLFNMGLSYEDPRAEDVSDTTMELVSYYTILASTRLAKERGAYPSYPGSKWQRGLLPQDTIKLLAEQRGQDIQVPQGGKLDWQPIRQAVRKWGMRNSNTMAIAPTATISNIAGTYPCIEPAYKNLYVKSNMSGEFTLVNRYLVEDLKVRGLWTKDLRDQLKYHDGSVQNIAAIPEEIQKRYLEAFEIDPLTLLRHTARRSKWIDQSQSHNVFMRGTSGAQLEKIYMAAWQMGLKTTYYLRTLAASQIEKSTLDAKQFGFTQKRHSQVPETCAIDDPDCEACQ